MSERQVTLHLLHDLALLYLTLMHSDEEQHPAEEEAIAVTLRRWRPDEDPALIDHVTREATLTYDSGERKERLQEALRTLKDALSEEEQRLVVADLHALADADGAVLTAEHAFIDQVARAWDLSANT